MSEFSLGDATSAELKVVKHCKEQKQRLHMGTHTLLVPLVFNSGDLNHCHKDDDSWLFSSSLKAIIEKMV